MAIEIKLPVLGDGIESGDVLEVLVREGDQIGKDQGIIEIETDKATVEVPSSHAGRVTQVHVGEGDTVRIGQTLITLEAETAAPQAAPEAPAEPKAAAATQEAKPSAEPAPTKSPAASRPAVPAPPPPPASPTKTPPPVAIPTAAVPPPQTQPAGSAAVMPAGPAVRRFAREVGIDLQHVSGSGPSGRITREDVLQSVRSANQAGRVAGPGPETAGDSDADAWGVTRVEKMTKIRKTIAAKMHQSWTTAPRVTNFDDADVSELERIRQASKNDYAAKGIKLTSLPFVIKSVAAALRDHPAVNASLDPEREQIVYKQYVNIGIAVDTERGLVVPSLRNADRLSIPEVAKQLAAIAEKVRDGNFTVDDLRGSTFTISNLGAIGGTYSTPIINVPEVAILLVGRSRKMPVVVGEEIGIRLMMPLSLSYDHRLVDGATAARFLNDVIAYLEAPSRLLLAP